MITLSLVQLLDYSDHERAKWKAWVKADPLRLSVPFQAGLRFPNAWSLLDHLFLVERRHLSRLEGGTPPDSTGVAEGDWQALFEYADLVRIAFRKFVDDVTPERAAETITFTVPIGTFTMSRQKLATHVLLHEVRHLAQLALAARLAGHEPPGDHDYAFAPIP